MDCAAQGSRVLPVLGTQRSMRTGSHKLPPKAKGLQESIRGARNQEDRRLLNQQPKAGGPGREGGGQATGWEVGG